MCTFGVFPSAASRVRSRSWEGGAMKMTKGFRLEDLNTRSDYQEEKQMWLHANTQAHCPLQVE